MMNVCTIPPKGKPPNIHRMIGNGRRGALRFGNTGNLNEYNTHKEAEEAVLLALDVVKRDRESCVIFFCDFFGLVFLDLKDQIAFC